MKKIPIFVALVALISISVAGIVYSQIDKSFIDKGFGSEMVVIASPSCGHQSNDKPRIMSKVSINHNNWDWGDLTIYEADKTFKGFTSFEKGNTLTNKFSADPGDYLYQVTVYRYIRDDRGIPVDMQTIASTTGSVIFPQLECK